MLTADVSFIQSVINAPNAFALQFAHDGIDNEFVPRQIEIFEFLFHFIHQLASQL